MDIVRRPFMNEIYDVTIATKQLHPPQPHRVVPPVFGIRIDNFRYTGPCKNHPVYPCQSILTAMGKSSSGQKVESIPAMQEVARSKYDLEYSYSPDSGICNFFPIFSFLNYDISRSGTWY